VDTLVSDGNQNLNSCFRENGTGRREPEPDFASQLATRNAWLDLNAKVPADLRSTHLPNIWKASTLNGKSFAFLGISPRG